MHEKDVQGTEVQGTVGKYRARWRSTGHGEEVQGTVRKYRDTVEK